MTTLDEKFDGLVREEEEKLLREYRQYADILNNSLISSEFSRRYHHNLAMLAGFGNGLHEWCCDGSSTDLKFYNSIEPVLLKYLHKIDEMYQRVAKKLGIELEPTKMFESHLLAFS